MILGSNKKYENKGSEWSRKRRRLNYEESWYYNIRKRYEMTTYEKEMRSRKKTKMLTTKKTCV